LKIFQVHLTRWLVSTQDATRRRRTATAPTSATSFHAFVASTKARCGAAEVA